MSSNRRSRPPQQRHEPEDEGYVTEQRPARRDPRRRTPFVPRQEASPPEDAWRENPEPPVRQRRRRQVPPGGRSQQQPTSRPPRRQQADVYPEDEFDDAYDDRLIDEGSRRGRSTPRRAAHHRADYAEPGYYADEYDEFEDGFDDGFIDEDDWYEEEAAAGGYQRPRRSTPRPMISLPTFSRDALPRPTVPDAVRGAALIQDRLALMVIGVLFVSLIGMVIVAMTRVDTLAPGFATHVSASGIRESFRSETALWQLPLMAGAFLLMNGVLAWFLAQWSGFSARFVLATSIIVQVVIWVALLRFAF